VRSSLLLLEVEYHAHWVAAFAVVITPTPRFYFITAGRSSFLMEKREPGMVGGPTRDSALSRGPLRRAKGGQRSGHVTVLPLTLTSTYHHHPSLLTY
jgi:hypothetical protein